MKTTTSLFILIALTITSQLSAQSKYYLGIYSGVFDGSLAKKRNGMPEGDQRETETWPLGLYGGLLYQRFINDQWAYRTQLGIHAQGVLVYHSYGPYSHRAVRETPVHLSLTFAPVRFGQPKRNLVEYIGPMISYGRNVMPRSITRFTDDLTLGVVMGVEWRLGSVRMSPEFRMYQSFQWHGAGPKHFFRGRFLSLGIAFYINEGPFKSLSNPFKDTSN